MEARSVPLKAEIHPVKAGTQTSPKTAGFFVPSSQQQRKEISMAIILEASYSKKLGLPNYSSHSFVVSIRTELTDLSQVEEESTRLYGMLQAAVDKEMQQPGFVPDEAYGVDNIRKPVSNGYSRNGNGHTNGNGHSNGNERSASNGYSRNNGNGNTNGHSRQASEDSGISEKQIGLIQDIIKQNNARKGDVENLSVDMFGGGVRTLSRMQASNLIDALFDRYPRQPSNTGQRQPARA